MKFHITTQYLENYGDDANPYWKCKGGEEYIIDVPGFNYEHEMAFKKGQMIMDTLYDKIEYSNEYTQEYIVSWGFVPDDFETLFERDQLEDEGKVTFPAKRINFDELMETA